LLTLTETEAASAANFIRDAYPEVSADPVNPRQVITLHLDRWTAQTFRDALGSFVESGACADSMLEIFDAWLSFEGGQCRRAVHRTCTRSGEPRSLRVRLGK
jgi:hypothetical protein